MISTIVLYVKYHNWCTNASLISFYNKIVTMVVYTVSLVYIMLLHRYCIHIRSRLQAYISFKVTGYIRIIFNSAKLYCLQKQPFDVLY